MILSSPSGKKVEPWILLVPIAFCLFVLYVFVVPPFEVSDEVWHYPFVDRLARGEGLPIQRGGLPDTEAPWRQEGSQPPLYYAVAALGVRLIPPQALGDIRQLNPHSDMGHVRQDGNANMVMHLATQPVPWGIYVARLVSALFATGTVVATYGVTAELLYHGRPTTSSSRFWCFSSALTVALIPMVAFISGSVNNDNAAIFFSTLGIWLALRTLRQGTLSWREAVGAGSVVGLGALSKSSVLGLLPLFGLVALLVMLFSPRPIVSAPRQYGARLLRYGTIVVGVALAISGWWFLRNKQLYGDWLGWNAFLDVAGRRLTTPSWSQLWSERYSFVRSFWGLFGAMNVMLPPWLYRAFDLLSLGAVLGIARGVMRAWRRGAIDGVYVQRGLVTVTYVALLLFGLLRWTSLTLASQGRLLFPMISLIAIALVYGVAQWHRALVPMVMGGLAIVTLLVPFLVIRPAYAAPQALDTLPPLNHPLGTTFGDALVLLGAEVPEAPVRPGDASTVTLYWEAIRPLPARYSVFVHLVDSRGVIVAQRDMYPGQGNLATDQLEAGYRWKDRYTLTVPPWAHAPTALNWQFGLYDHQTGARLPITQGGTGETAIIVAAPLEPRVSHTPIITYNEGMTLMGVKALTPVLQPEMPLQIELTWRSLKSIQQRYVLSLQLFDDHGQRFGQWDGDLGNGTLSTPAWPPQSDLTEVVAIPTVTAMPQGQYHLFLIWYEPDTFERLVAYDTNQQVIGTEVEVARFRIP